MDRLEEYCFDDALTERPHRRRLNAEGAIGLIGWIFGAVGALGVAAAGFRFFRGVFGTDPAGEATTEWFSVEVAPWVALIIALCASVLMLWAGFAAVRFHPWARWPLVALCVLLLADGAIGGSLDVVWLGFTIFVLVAFFGRRGRLVFSREYGEILAAEPELRPAYRNSIGLWVIVILCGFLLNVGCQIPIG